MERRSMVLQESIFSWGEFYFRLDYGDGDPKSLIFVGEVKGTFSCPSTMEVIMPFRVCHPSLKRFHASAIQ